MCTVTTHSRFNFESDWLAEAGRDGPGVQSVQYLCLGLHVEDDLTTAKLALADAQHEFDDAQNEDDWEQDAVELNNNSPRRGPRSTVSASNKSATRTHAETRNRA